MKKRLFILTLTMALVFSSMPVMAETVSDNSVSANIVETDTDYVTETDFVSGYVPDETDYGSPVRTEEYERQMAATYPAKYDPRESAKSTPVRLQVGGSCWLYAAMGAVEGNLVKKGLAGPSVDLSELQVAYFMAHPFDDPLGYYTEDLNYRKYTSTGNALDYGGNEIIAISQLSRWTGPVFESEAPLDGNVYNTGASTDGIVLDNSLATKSNYHFKGSKSSIYSVANVKELITKYGAVSAGYHTDYVYYKVAEKGADASYYCPTKQTPNHAITIIGWDDSYAKENFRVTPAGNGAFLVKNSWGTNWVAGPERIQSSGYFWISYYDPSLSEINAVEFDSNSIYKNMYCYDGTDSSATTLDNKPGSGVVSDKSTNRYSYPISAYDQWQVFSKKLAYMNVYTAKAGGTEKLEAVMTRLAANTAYKITVYANPQIIGNRLVGYSAKETVMGKSDYAGFYTVSLNNPLYLAEGNKFAIYIKTDKSGGVVVSNTYQNDGEVYVAEDTDTLVDLKPYSLSGGYSQSQIYTPVLRGLTNPVNGFTYANAVTLNKGSMVLAKGSSDTLSAVVSPANATKRSVGYYTSDPDVAVVDESGKVTAVGAGSCVITAKSYDGKAQAQCNVSVTVPAPNPGNSGGSGTAVPKVKSFTAGKVSYKVSGKNVTVTKIKNTKSLNIASTVTYKGVKYSVTEIASGAGKNLKSLTKLVIPKTVKKIGKSAFSGCKKLKSVTVGENVKSIGSKAFYNCPKLSKVTFKGTKVKSIGSSAFKKCKKGMTVKVPKSKKKAYKKLLKGKTTGGAVVK